MLERHIAAFLILIEPREKFREDLLGQIFLGRADGTMTAHNANDQGIKPLDQQTGRLRFALANSTQALRKLDVFSVRIHALSFSQSI